MVDDEDLVDTATRAGNLEMLEWLRSQGCPWDKELSIILVETYDRTTDVV